MKAKSSGKYSKIIIDENGDPVGQALQLSNGNWAPFDFEDRRLTSTEIVFKTPAAVAKFFKIAREAKP